ncbi:MAG: PAS domain S-box protein [Granulosicoccus sp.]
MPRLEKYELAFEITPLPMLMVAKGGEIILVNKLFGDLFEYEPEQLVGNNVEMLIPEVSRHGHPGLRDSYFTAPSKRTMGQGRELSGTTRSGSVIPLELGLDTVTIENEVYAMVIALDITTRKQNEHYMNAVVGAAASAMVMVNTVGNIVFVNKAALALFGYQKQHLIGLPIEQLVPQNVQPVHRRYLDKFMQKRSARSMAKGLEIFALHRNGKHIPVDIALTPVDTPDGEMVVCTVIDLSERVSAELAMAKKSAELKRVNIELQKFAYSASHDLKAPITTMAGLLSLCIEDLEDNNIDVLRENIHKAISIGQRSLKKVEIVLEIARVGVEPVAPQLIDLEQLIGEIWLDLTGAHKGGIILKLELQHANSLHISLNALTVILENLLSNAIRYADHKKNQQIITIESRCDDQCVQVCVTDNGIGIPEGSKDAIFSMFHRISEQSNHGLGLSLVKKYVTNLSGSITFESTKGEGSVFRLSLPLSPPLPE